MELKQYIEILAHQVKESFKNERSGHDIHHLIRTMNIALRIQKIEGGDRIIIGIAAFLHDMHRLIQNETGAYCSPKDSLDRVEHLLRNPDLGLSEDQISSILLCIELHEEYDFTTSGKTAKCIEALIIQDADNLDAIGAIGVAREFSYAGAHGELIWDPEIPIKEAVYDETNTTCPSAIHHFYEKLLKLKNNMNTATAKALADERHRFMEAFLSQFFDEWEGKK